MRKSFILLTSICITVSLSAQEDTTKAKELDAVVITGQYKPQSAKNSVYQVRTISRERIQRQGAIKLQDVLNNELNIRFSQDLSTGGSGITMMGLPGQNVKILVDGVPMVGRQGFSNEVDINQIDINSIERIELVEGPMSVVYGADALAGVINIITKKGGAAKFTVNARLQEESVGNEYGIKQGIHNQYLGFTARHKNWELGGSFGHNYFGGWKDTAIERELVWHKKDQLMANGFVGYTKGKFNVRYRIDGLDEIITNPANFLPYGDPNSGDTLAYDQEYLSQRIMQQVQASYFANSNFNIQLQASYSDYSRQVFSTTVNKANGDTRLDPGVGRQSVVDFNGFTFRSTAYYKLSSLFSFQPGIDINLESGEGERLENGNNKVNDYAFFITSEITPSQKINIRPGLRIIKNSVYDSPPVIPSLNTKIVLTNELDLRLSYANGFRSPSLRELYFSFFDANHQVVGNPDLKAETSNSFTGSLNWKKNTNSGVIYNIAAGGFYNSVKNLIDYVFTQASDTARLYNVANSKTGGVNINASLKHKGFNISAGASYTGFFNEYSAADKSLPELQWSPEANIIAGYSFTAIRLDVNLFYKFTGMRPRYVTNGPDIILAKTDAYHMADITLNKKLFQHFSLTAGIRNIFDTDRIRSSFVSGGIHASGGLNVGTGRSLFTGLVFNWEKK